VLKRDGRKEAVSFDKITSRIKRLSWGLPNEFCDPVRASRRLANMQPRPQRLRADCASGVAGVGGAEGDCRRVQGRHHQRAG
jgi:hypothetical protein